MTDPEPAMTAADVKEALLVRWPPADYLSIYEAPQGADRGGRKLDVLVVALWNSRGHAVDGVEIKVSVSDWRRELKDPSKADWWWERCNRFWIAAPAAVAQKIKPELPPNWGLLSCTPGKVRVAVKPEARRDRAELTWQTTVGLLRATADCGVNALLRERGLGRNEGYRQAKAELELGRGEGRESRQLERAREETRALEAVVSAFEEASGIKLPLWEHSAGDVGAIVALIMEARVQGPAGIDRRLGRQIDELRSIVDSAEKTRAALASVMGAPASDAYPAVDQPEEPNG